MKKKNDDNETYNDGLFEQIAFQGVDRFLNESRSIVAGDDFNTARESLSNLSELLLDPVDDGEGVLPIAHHHDPADRLAVAVPLGGALPQVGSQTHHAQVSYQHRRAIIGCDRNVFEI